MITAYCLLVTCGLLYGVVLTHTPSLQPTWTTAFSFARLIGAAFLLYYLLQFTGIPPILGLGTFLAGMWIWILIHIQRL